MNSQQVDFLEKEFHISPQVFSNMSRDAIGDLYDKVCDIEVDEILAHMDKELSERGNIATTLVDYLYNNYSN